MTDHADAPVAYPEINNATKALRSAAAAAGDAEALHLWAGQGFRSSKDLPAGKIVQEIVSELGQAVDALDETRGSPDPPAGDDSS